MSSVIESTDLTLYGCPMHYIKAREIVGTMQRDQAILFKINNGDAVDDVIKSLRQDGQICEIESKQPRTSTVKVIKRT
ncbi:MAG: TusA-related sulfurtransferase [Methylophagaceae bacterium]|jgi:TusA-related sulfurtransferase